MGKNKEKTNVMRILDQKKLHMKAIVMLIRER